MTNKAHLLYFFAMSLLAAPVWGQEARWKQLDALFTESFDTWSDRPVELEVFARKALMQALEEGDCDGALVAHSLVARASMMLNQPATAEDNFLALPPGCADEFPRLHYDLGYRMMQAGELKLAEERLLKATESKKWASHAWNLLGTLRSSSGDYSGAVEAWKAAQAAVEGIPNPSIYVNLGTVASNRGQWHEAVSWFNLALEAQVWNERENAYTFLYDIWPVIHTNLLRSAVNARDTALADVAWHRMWPVQQGQFPLFEVRTLLDYAIWRQRVDLIPGIVGMFEDQVVNDSLEAHNNLNDRVLLFSPWRRVTGWSVERTAQILAQAESMPLVSRDFPIVPASSEGIQGKADRAMLIHRIMLAATGLALAFAGWWWAQWWRFRAQRNALHQLAHGEFIAILNEPNENHRFATSLLKAELIRRLKAHTLAFRIPGMVFDQLNQKELIILQLILNGATSAEIAKDLNMSLQRVYNLRSGLRAKLGLAPGVPYESLIQ